VDIRGAEEDYFRDTGKRVYKGWKSRDEINAAEQKIRIIK
jgi:hypothetical protein